MDLNEKKLSTIGEIKADHLIAWNILLENGALTLHVVDENGQRLPIHDPNIFQEKSIAYVQNDGNYYFEFVGDNAYFSCDAEVLDMNDSSISRAFGQE